MKSMIGILLLGAVLASLSLGRANPFPTEIPALEHAIRVVVETQGQEGRAELIHSLGVHGLALVSEEALNLVRTNMTLLEPCILASQLSTDWLEPRLHHEFRARACRSARESMCTTLRIRLASRSRDVLERCGSTKETKGLLRAFRPQVRRLVETAEVLSDYSDTLALPQIGAVLYEIEKSFCNRIHFTRGAEPPSWFLRLALRRVRDPEAVAVLQLKHADAGIFRVCRDASEIMGLRVTADAGDNAHWHAVQPEPVRDRRILAHLAASRPAADPVPFVPRGFRSACMEIRFKDGVTATIDVWSTGVDYTDNTRSAPVRYRLACQALVDDIWKIVEQFEDMVEF